jgi:hypothetical protein
MRSTEAGSKQGEKGAVRWPHLVMWGTFLSVIMFGLGFVTGSRWAEQKSAEWNPSPVTRLMPPPMGVLQPARQAFGTGEEEVGDKMWDILTRDKDATVHTDLSDPVRKREVSEQPAARSSEPTSPSAAQAASSYIVQVGSSRDAQRAEALVRKLKSKGYPSPRMLRVEIQGGGIWYRIRVGSFPRKALAEEWAAKIRQQERLDPLVLEEKPQSR